MRKRFCYSILMICFGVIVSGCSIVMTLNQPSYKDLSRIRKGTTRQEVIGYLGPPSLVEEQDGRKKDVFVFTQGYGKGHKGLRVFLHSAADFYTLGLWEIVGSPAEMIANGRDVRFEVLYDEKGFVDTAKVLQLLPEIAPEEAGDENFLRSKGGADEGPESDSGNGDSNWENII